MRLKTSSADDSVNYRYSGILVHPTSFPSPYESVTSEKGLMIL